MNNNKPCIFSYVALAILTIFILLIVFGFKVTISKNTSDSNITIKTKGGLRPSCLKCVRKHISQAIVLLSESQKGYPEHFWIAMGHLAEAEDESIKEYPDLANKIRDARELIIAGDKVNLVNLYPIVDETSKKN